MTPNQEQKYDENHQESDQGQKETGVGEALRALELVKDRRISARTLYSTCVRAVLFILIGVLVSSCSAESNRVRSQPFTLRVGTHDGITPMGPGLTSGITPSLQGLVYARVQEHFDVVTVNGNVATLRRRPESKLGSRELFDALEHPLLLSKRLDREVVFVEVSDSAVFDSEERSVSLDVGAYEQTSVSDAQMVLQRRRGEVGPASIEVHHFASQQEEWRRFLAGEVDVVPLVGPSSARQLSSVPSVRILPVPEGSGLAIYFNMRSPAVDGQLRRAISLALRRGALAEYAVGDRQLAVEFPEDLDQSRRTMQEKKLDHRLVLLVFAGSTEMRRAAMTIQHQLSVIGVDVAVEPVGIDQLPARTAAGDYDLVVYYGDYSRRRLSYLQTGSPGNFVRYSSPEFDLALANKDWDRCLEIVREDLPMTPLFRLPAFSAVDRKFCGARPATVHDLSWLADVHPCAPGELE